MKKDDAIKLLGGTVSEAARAIGIMPQAVSQWPDVLPSRTSDRVIAALARKDPAKWADNWRKLQEASHA